MKLATLCLLAIAGCIPLRGQNVRQNFKNPPKAYRPMVRWWWPGGDVTDVELRREVGLLDQANFGGAEIQPFLIGLNPHMTNEAQERVNSYLTPTFFSHTEAALEEARSRRMWLDYTFGSGWPFGGAGAITPELAAVELRFEHLSIRGPVRFHRRIPIPNFQLNVDGLPKGWAERFQQREKLVAVVAIRGGNVNFIESQSPDERPRVKAPGELDAGTSIVLTDHMLPDGTLDWNVPEGTWQVFTFEEMPTLQQVNGASGEGPQFVLDHMNREAFNTYAERVGGATRQYNGSFFGNGLRAVFCDSFEVGAFLYWSDNFLEEFRKRRGYDLTPYLPILKIPGFGTTDGGAYAGLPLYDIKGISARVRQDYWQTVSDVMFDNFYSPFNQWATNNRLLSRVQAHGSPTDLLRVYGAANIPETEDLYDHGRYDFLKMASSAADLYGRKIVSSESFVWEGKVYQTTPEKIKRYADELLTAGINEIIYHGYPYEYMDRPEPGWVPFATVGGYSSDMNQHNTFWPYLGRLNEYITRIQYLSQIGTTVVPVALYREGLAYDAVAPPPPEPEINTSLMAAGYNFDHIDADTMLKSKVVDGKLISPGGASYSVLVLENQKNIPDRTALQLIAFAKSGLPIILIGRTQMSREAIMHGQLENVIFQNILPEFTGLTNVHITCDTTEAINVLRATISPNLSFTGAPLPFIEKRIGRLDAFFLRNPDDNGKRVEADFTAVGDPEIWDPWTGMIQPLTHFERHGNKIRVSIDIDPYGSLLLVFDADAKPATNSVPAASQLFAPIAVGREGWKFHGVGIGPGSQPVTYDLELPGLLDWTMNSQLKNFSGRGQYTTRFTIPPNFFGSHHHIILDLGDVKDVAEITTNGNAGPILLLRPYRADVTQLVRPGENILQVTVVNTLYNALSARGPSKNYIPERSNTANGLLPSGLIGPVRLEEQ